MEHAVEAALRAGYRHIDTAYAYGNEKEVGKGIRASGVPREEIWLTTKLDNDWHKKVPQAIDASLKNLGTDYVDLYLMHWPASIDAENKSKVYDDWDFVDTWREMQKLLGTGKVRNIGISNFAIRNLEKLLNHPSCKVRWTMISPNPVSSFRDLSPSRKSYLSANWLTVALPCRLYQPSTRSSCTPVTPPRSWSRITPPRASTRRATPPWGATTRLSTRTRRSSRLPRRRDAHLSRWSSCGGSRRDGASSPRA